MNNMKKKCNKKIIIKIQINCSMNLLKNMLRKFIEQEQGWKTKKYQKNRKKFKNKM